MEPEETFYDILWIIAFTLSLISSMILYVSLGKKKSNYAKLMRYISISEAIFIFIEFIFVYNSSFIIKDFSKNLINWYRYFRIFNFM